MTRRPIKSRNTWLAGRVTRWLAGTSIQPNHISVFSMFAAAVAGLAFYASGHVGPVLQSISLFTAALMCQVRLLCNLFDGMLAAEAGKSSGAGALWNEFPDRVADLLILIGVGFAIDWPALGWAAACMSILTAYIRELGSRLTGHADYSGPMAKPHRMAVITVAALAAIVESWWSDSHWVLLIALWVVTLGALYTSLLRIRRQLATVR